MGLQAQVDLLAADKEAALTEVKDLKEEMSNVFVKFKEQQDNAMKEVDILRERLAEKEKKEFTEGQIASKHEENKELDNLSLIHICRCRRYAVCRSRGSPYH
eukprot:TRINITY_DN27202_c0_g1_i1.p2 TRINITY_DN27202_c0_g1~~TRINITY_DN27202_c0_g1_i1.p2  ORF type:complete len:102 (-),score=23.21 TRINITY_DN27202_c0_g1_i1:11-316(-)